MIRRQQQQQCIVYCALLCALIVSCVAAPSDVRCFVGEFAPLAQDPAHTLFRYAIDTLVTVPIELTLPVLEFSAVLNDRCTWSTRIDALMFYVNGVLASYWPTHCSSSSPMLFGVSTNAASSWGSHPRSPYNADALFEAQNGRIDMRTATWSVRQRPMRNRTLELRMFSGSELRFMPAESAPPPLYVRICALDRQVPSDWRDAPGDYREIPPPEHTVFPLSSCVYEHAGGCGAQLGYVSTAPDGSAVVLRRHGSHNYLVPSSVENGWTLPGAFPSGLRDPGQAPHMHVGWHCADGEAMRWHLNGSALRLDAQSRRCISTVYTAEEDTELRLGFGIRPLSLFALQKPQAIIKEQKISVETAHRYWSLHHIDVPVLAERNATAVDADAAAAAAQSDGDDAIY